MTDVKAILHRYFAAFNVGDIDAMLAELSPDVEHHVNEGEMRLGKARFREFCTDMARCYDEQLRDIVVFTNATGTQGAAEYMVHGTYIATGDGLPEAKGQTYVLPAGSFMTLEGGKITRVTTYYNRSNWLAQIS